MYPDPNLFSHLLIVRTKSDRSSRSFEEDKNNCQINANKIIYFKIINTEAEFDDFQNMNLENSFQPTYTYELFANEVIPAKLEVFPPKVNLGII